MWQKFGIGPRKLLCVKRPTSVLHPVTDSTETCKTSSLIRGVTVQCCTQHSGATKSRICNSGGESDWASSMAVTIFATLSLPLLVTLLLLVLISVCLYHCSKINELCLQTDIADRCQILQGRNWMEIQLKSPISLWGP